MSEARFNAPQREAVRYLDGPCLVLAGAGSGKTRVITHKIAYLLNDCGFKASQVAAITFTNKAAREMQERVAHLLGGRVPAGLTVSTFHALGVKIVREEAKALGLKPRFSILDAADGLAIVTDCAANAEKDVARQLQWHISSWKNALITPDEAIVLADNELSRAAAQTYREYERTLRAYQAVDFDDLIALPVRLFETQPDVRERWQNRLRYLLIDEYQDTNRAQYELLKRLVGTRAAFTAVGDDDQGIYAWRGADVENLQRLKQDFPSLELIKLEQNYRSSGHILTVANTLIAHNEKLFEKALWCEHGPGDPVAVQACKDPEHEAQWVAMRIATHRFERKTAFRDYAVLYRGNHQARLLEQALRDHHVPYVLSGGQSFFEKAEIRDLLAYLRLLVNEDEDLAFIRALTTPKRGVGPTTLEALGQYAGLRHLSLFAAALEEGCAQHLPPQGLEAVRTFAHFITRFQYRATREPAARLLDELLKAIAYEAWLFDHAPLKEAETKWKNVCDFVAWLGRKGEEEGKNLIELTQTVTLISMLDKEDPAFDGVLLATLHASKGLEFAHVFLIGLEEGVLPHQASIDEEKVDEERRLTYVGITRARKSLTLTYPRRRKQAGGQWRDVEPSRFLDEMGNTLTRHDRAKDGALAAVRPDFAAMKALLEK
jgi:ATP-dependent DNA helicase Rep